MEILQNKRYLGLAGVICLVLGTMLPYYTWSLFGVSDSLSLIGYWEGYVIILAAIASALFIFRDYVEKYIPNAFNSGLLGKIKTANPKLVIIPVAIAALVAIYLTTSIDIDKSIIKYGIGFWVTWIGVVLLVAHIILYKGETASNTGVVSQVAQPMQQGFNQPVQNNMGYQQQPQQNPNMMNNQFVQQPQYDNQQMTQNNQFTQQQYNGQPVNNQGFGQANTGFGQPQQQDPNMMNNQFPNNNNQF